MLKQAQEAVTETVRRLRGATVDNTREIKDAIVDGYRRGVCDHNGNTIPRGHRGMNGKGSHFMTPTTQKFRDNYDKIDWSK